MAQLFTNNASATLAANVDDGTTDDFITLNSGFGSLFPTVTGASNDYFLVTVQDSSGAWEIIRVDDSSTTDQLGSSSYPLQRDYEASIGGAKSFLAGSRVEIRLTSGTLDSWIQNAGDTMEGDLDFNQNEIQGALLTENGTGGAQCIGENMVLRSASGVTAHQLKFNGSGTEPQVNGSDIATDQTLQDDNFAQTDVAETITASWDFDATATFNSAPNTENVQFSFNQDVSSPWLAGYDLLGANAQWRLNRESDSRISFDRYDGGAWVRVWDVYPATGVAQTSGIWNHIDQHIFNEAVQPAISFEAAGSQNIDKTNSGNLNFRTSSSPQEILFSPNGTERMVVGNSRVTITGVTLTVSGANVDVSGNITTYSGGDITAAGKISGNTVGNPFFAFKWAPATNTISEGSPNTSGFTASSGNTITHNLSSTYSYSIYKVFFSDYDDHNNIYVNFKSSDYFIMNSDDTFSAGDSVDVLLIGIS